MAAGNELKAGLFFALSVVAFCGSIWVLGREREIFASLEQFQSSFTNVAGLSPGAPVRLGGITVGRVSDIKFGESSADSRVYVSFLVNSRYVDRVRSDSIASIETQGLLGDKFLSLSLATGGSTVAPGSVIPSREPADLQATVTRVQGVIDDTAIISKDLRAFTATLTEVSTKLKDGDGILHALVYEPKGKELIGGLRTAIERLGAAANGIETLSAEVRDGGGIRAVVENLHLVTADLRAAASSLASGEGTLGALLVDSQLYDNLIEVTDGAKRSFLLREAIRSTIK